MQECAAGTAQSATHCGSPPISRRWFKRTHKSPCLHERIGATLNPTASGGCAPASWASRSCMPHCKAPVAGSIVARSSSSPLNELSFGLPGALDSRLAGRWLCLCHGVASAVRSSHRLTTRLVRSQSRHAPHCSASEMRPPSVVRLEYRPQRCRPVCCDDPNSLLLSGTQGAPYTGSYLQLQPKAYKQTH